MKFKGKIRIKLKKYIEIAVNINQIYSDINLKYIQIWHRYVVIYKTVYRYLCLYIYYGYVTDIRATILIYKLFFR